MFTSGNELLRQQLPEPTRGLDRPRSLIPERNRPRQQPIRLTPVRDHLEPGDRTLLTIDRDRHVRGLVRIDPDDHRHEVLLVNVNRRHDGHS